MTDKQKQLLLAYLGYYVGEIDGNFGKMSIIAAKAFQKDYGLKPDGIVGKDTQKAMKHAVSYGMPIKNETENFWNDIKHFKKDEFRCKCGGKYCDGFPAEPSEMLVRLADRVRDHYGVPMIISSGIRCITHNTKVGGAVSSRHMRGLAVDFCVKGKTSAEVLEYVWKQPEARYAYAIDDNYVHMDVDV